MDKLRPVFLTCCNQVRVIMQPFSTSATVFVGERMMPCCADLETKN